MHVRATRGALQCIPGPSRHHRPFRELCARAIKEDLFPFVFPNVPASSKVGKPQGERLGGVQKGGLEDFHMRNGDSLIELFSRCWHFCV